MKRPWLKLLIFLVPALAGTLFLWWWLSPEQAIVRRADALFASLEKKTLETGTATDKAERFRSILHPDFTVKAPRPIPSGPVPPEAAARRVHDLQDSITASRISRSDQRVTFPSDGRAVYEATVQVDITLGRSSPLVFRYRCHLEFEREGRDWLLHRAVVTVL